MSEDDVASSTEELNEFMHPKRQQGFRFIEGVSQVIVEEDGKDVTYGLHLSVAPVEGYLQQLHLEFTHEDDIYFIRRWEMTEEQFKTFKKDQHLRKSDTFGTFVEKLTALLSNVASNRTTFQAVFVGDNLEFRQRLEFKVVTIVALAFQQLDPGDEYVRDQAQFRYAEKQSMLGQMKVRLTQLFAHVEKKNPQLAQQLKRGSKFAQKET